jgi:fructose-1,6-bisphosphatase/inositol monophosphatase family enzyme
MNIYDAVTDLVAETAAEILDMWHRGDIEPIDPQAPEPVTIADLRSHRRIVDGLQKIDPRGVVISEEDGTPWRDRVRGAVRGQVPLWILDPLDGTDAFSEGKPYFGVQLALILDGAPAAAWIHCPAQGRFANATHRSELVTQRGPSERRAHFGEHRALSQVRAVIADGDFEEVHLRKIAGVNREFRSIRGTESCAADYLDFVDGNVDLLLYRRTRPWDHCAGAYLAERKGAETVNFAGHQPSLMDEHGGLLVAGPNLRAALGHRLLPDTPA